MAESNGAVGVHPMSAAPAMADGSNGSGGGDSDEIVARIERTRENLAQTIDTLADRVSPAGNARRLRELAMEQTRRPEVRIAAAAAGFAVAGLLVWRFWGRRKK